MAVSVGQSGGEMGRRTAGNLGGDAGGNAGRDQGGKERRRWRGNGCRLPGPVLGRWRTARGCGLRPGGLVGQATSRRGIYGAGVTEKGPGGLGDASIDYPLPFSTPLRTSGFGWHRPMVWRDQEEDTGRGQERWAARGTAGREDEPGGRTGRAVGSGGRMRHRAGRRGHGDRGMAGAQRRG